MRPNADMTESDATIERVYAEQASRILAVLVRLFGPRNLELAEDVLQEAFRKALVTWREAGVPQNPLRASHLPSAVLAHLSAMLGDRDTANRYAEESKRLGGAPHEHRSMLAQVERLLGQP